MPESAGDDGPQETLACVPKRLLCVQVLPDLEVLLPALVLYTTRIYSIGEGACEHATMEVSSESECTESR